VRVVGSPCLRCRFLHLGFGVAIGHRVSLVEVVSM
jgi:hypothetical protein